MMWQGAAAQLQRGTACKRLTISWRDKFKAPSPSWLATSPLSIISRDSMAAVPEKTQHEPQCPCEISNSALH